MSDVRNEKAFLEKVSPVYGGLPLLIPPGSLSPLERTRRRLAFRNQLYVYPQKSLFSGESLISMFSAAAPFGVISNDEWFGDSWDGCEFGIENDPSRGLFEQIERLRNSVPHSARSALFNENCDFASNLAHCKNCYLIFNSTHVENSMYGENMWRSRDCIESSYISDCELCYDCLLCENCYNLQCSLDCEGCSDSWYLLGCRSCRNCFGCANLRHAQYQIWNKQVTREDFEEFIAGLKLESRKERTTIAAEVELFWRSQPRPQLTMKHAENSSGNYLFNCKDVENSFFIRDGESLANCSFLYGGAKDCRDFSFVGLNSELMYECAWCALDARLCRFCFWCLQSDDMFYCWHCISCRHCFACAGLRGKEYCILNKQYRPEEYERIVPALIQQMIRSGEWGEYFPITMSGVPYNHSMAQRFFPLTSDEARKEGCLWYDRPLVSAENAVPLNLQPDLPPADDKPLSYISRKSGTAFRITSEEQKRYRCFKAPLPEEAYDERLTARARKLGGLQLYRRTCGKSGREIVSHHPEGDGWIVWSVDEYENLVA